MSNLAKLLERTGYSPAILDKGPYECRICGAGMSEDQGLCEECAGGFLQRRASEVESIKRSAKVNTDRAMSTIQSLIAEKAQLQSQADSAMAEVNALSAENDALVLKQDEMQERIRSLESQLERAFA